MISKSTIKYVIYLTIICLTTQECLEGCLACNERDECLFCDSMNSYFLFSSSCKKLQIDNCKIIDLAGTCLVCQDNYYNDPLTQKCVLLDADGKITNCAIHKAPKQCLYCNKDFYLSGGQCTTATAVIPNCLYISLTNLSLCDVCELGYLLNIDKKSCFKITSETNCSSYTQYICQNCLDSYILDKNFYITQFYQYQTLDQKYSLLQKYINDSNKQGDQGYFKQCRKITIQNCKVLKNFYQCQECEDNYYINDQLECQSYPEIQIQGCLHYLDGQTCIQCIDGYYLLNSTTCLKVDEIKNCILYDSKASTIICLKCENDYYLDEINNICKSRSISSRFDDCDSRELKSDVCLSCKNGLQLTGDNLKCLNPVQNCLIYRFSDINNTNMICSQCKEGYYYDSIVSQCVKGNIDNCQQYSIEEEKCEKCNFGFYTTNKLVCLPILQIKQCTQYSINEQSTCTQCSDKNLLFSYKNFCLQSKVVDNCMIYDSDGVCSKCNSTFQLSGSTSCIQIPLTENCLEKENNNCVKCKTGYMRTTSGVCQAPQDYFLNKCEQHNIDGTIFSSNIECHYCQQNSIFLNYQNTFLCQKYDDVPLLNRIPFCLKYDSQFICVACESGKYLNLDLSQPVCLNQCDNQQIQINYVFDVQQTTGDFHLVNIKSPSACISAVSNLPNCKIASPKIFNTFMNITTNPYVTHSCVQCNPSFYPLVDFGNYVYTLDPIQYPQGQNEVSLFNAINCQTQVNSVNLIPIDNCSLYYYLTTENSIGCFKCSKGYRGVASNVRTINNCSLMSSCQTTDIITGIFELFPQVDLLKTPLTSLFSCYKCKIFQEIPVIRLDTTSQVKHEANSDQNIFSLNCENISTTSLTINSNFPFPTNCSLGIFSTNQNSLYCASCIEGYKPTFYANSFSIKTCTQIPNCISSTWFNACSSCKEGTIYRYDSTLRIIDYSICGQYSDLNCYAYNENNLGQKECQFCKKGFNKNFDGLCVTIDSNLCTSQFMTFVKNFETKDNQTNNNYITWLQPFGTGCNKCFQNYVSILNTEEKYLCSYMEYISSTNKIASTKVIQNCLNYKHSNGIMMCTICDTDYIPSTNGNCYSKTVSENCILLDGTIICKKCQEGFVVIQGVCKKQNLSNCKIFKQDPSLVQQECDQCNDTYYWNPINFACESSEVKFCKECTSIDKCKQCMPGYIKIIIKNNKDYCLKLDASFNCDIVRDDIVQDMQLECTTCKQGFYKTLQKSSYPQTVCLEILNIDNCIDYDFSQSYQEHNFLCSQCSDEYYLGNNLNCIERINKDIPHCQFYKPNLDICMSCFENYYLTQDGLTCKPYPSGPQGCIQFENSTKCTKCQSGQYLTNNTCQLVEQKFIIDQCKFYNGTQQCVECFEGYILEGQYCVSAQAQNCIKYANKIQCSICPDNYGFQEIDSIRHCVLKQTAFCISSEDTYPFKCLVCDKGFYPYQGQCIQVKQEIPFCIQYESDVKCLKCDVGTILNFDKSSCIQNDVVLNSIDVNCKQIDIGEPKCVSCAPGFVFDKDGKCQSCQNRTYENGCYMCDYIDPQKCLLCRSGYYQQFDGSCKKGTTSEVITPDNGGNIDNTNKKYIDSLRVLILTIILILF